MTFMRRGRHQKKSCGAEWISLRALASDAWTPCFWSSADCPTNHINHHPCENISSNGYAGRWPSPGKVVSPPIATGGKCTINNWSWMFALAISLLISFLGVLSCAPVVSWSLAPQVRSIRLHVNSSNFIMDPSVQDQFDNATVLTYAVTCDCYIACE